MDTRSVVTAYRRLANQYDRFFGPVFENGRKEALAKMACQSGDNVLEVGVGTGISIPQYPSGVTVTGIDVSDEMLEHARDKSSDYGDRVHLDVMDGENLSYEDNTFDKVVAMYVVSVTPEPSVMVEEMKRVCKPGGELFIVNHFSQDEGVMSKLEGLAAPLSKLIGFRPAFPLNDFLSIANLDVDAIEPVNAFGYWTLIKATNNK